MICLILSYDYGLRKKDIRKETRDLRRHKIIIQKEKNGWTHEVIDDEGKIVHPKYKK